MQFYPASSRREYIYLRTHRRTHCSNKNTSGRSIWRRIRRYYCVRYALLLTHIQIDLVVEKGAGIAGPAEGPDIRLGDIV
jgi:hypothetical protein